MSRAVYFSKVSLNTIELYDFLEEGNNTRIKVTLDILSSIKHEFIFYDTKSYFTDSGDLNTEQIEYSISIRNKDDESVEGVLYRKSLIFVKRKDENTGEMKAIPVENTEDILFYYDVLNEYVAYIARKRFGRNMFNNAFAMLLNESTKLQGYNYNFYVETYNSGMSLEEIKKIVKDEKDITQLAITYHPANPDDGIIEKAKKAKEKERMRISNATERSVIYKATGLGTIDGSAEIIQKDIDFLETLNEDMSINEMTKRGYINVTLHKKSGDVKTTAETKPYYKIIYNMMEFVDSAKNGIVNIIRKDIENDPKI